MRNGYGNGKGAKRGASEKQTETAERDDSPTAAAAEDKVVADSNPKSTGYTSADIGELLYMLEEEKLAGDLYEAFYADELARTCPECGARHPGREPPAGWVSLPPRKQD